ncbi:MAG: carboxypeptidase regulatory-like domain-containing protein [Cyclobacteriaceae bacterium]
MKKSSILAASLSIMIALVLSLTSNAQIFPTKLTATVIDGLGNFVEGAEVKIYLTEADYRGSTNPLFTAISKKKGRTKFKTVKSVIYFIEVTKGDMNNNGEGVQTGPLAAKKNNKVNIIIE